MPRYRRAERENALAETRERLLEAAVQEFAAKGYAEANVNHISIAAGFSKGTIYNYFLSKQALMLALLAHIATAHVTFVTEQVKSEHGPLRRLQRFFEAGFAFVESHPAKGRVLITSLYGGESGFREHMGRLYQPLVECVVTNILAPGIEGGVFRQVDPTSTARLLMTLYLGASSQVDENGRPYLDPMQVADLALHGLSQSGMLQGGSRK